MGRRAILTSHRKTTMSAVISSLLETDLYKFTLWQAMLHKHPQTQAEYSFVCRNESAFPLAELADEVNAELDHLCGLSFKADELACLRSLRYMKSDFVDFMRIFGFQRDFIEVKTQGPALDIVMKLTQANGQSVAKLSDTPGKTLCRNETFLAYLRQVFNVKG